MALPSASISIQDGSLGISPAASGNVGVVVGVCSKGTADTVYGAYRDVSTMVSSLGYGPAVEAAAMQLLRGGTVYVVPVTVNGSGSASSVTKVGTGVGTISTPAFAPSETITITCTTGGANGTAAFTYKVGSGATSAPVTSVAGATWAWKIPGTHTTLTLTEGTGFDATDAWTISNTQVVTQTVNPGPGNGSLAHTLSQPFDDYTCQVEIRSTGVGGTGTFRYTLDNFTDDGGNSLATWSADILIPATPFKYAIPNTGVFLTFSSDSFTDGDTHSFNITGPTCTTTEHGIAYDALVANTALSYGWIHYATRSLTAAAAATIAGAVDTDMTQAETAFRYIFGIVDVPTNGSRVASGAALVQTDSATNSAFASTTSTRVIYGAGDFLAVSPVNGRLCRRPASWQASAECAGRPISQNLHRVRTGPLKAVRLLYRDEGATEALDAGRFLTLRKHIGKVGTYITRGRTGASSTSDFSRVANRRVMDRACAVVYAEAVDLIGDTVTVNDDGTIKEKAAAAIETEINNALITALVNEGHASSSSVTVNRAWNVLSTGKIKIAVRVTPLGSADEIEVEIGFTNPNAPEA